ncbi:MAG: site-specific integrase, partial [Candidatus Pacebacteria bacterium]|nr:site-specific integrase [Candidatus Paceibacterota bacterium]
MHINKVNANDIRTYRNDVLKNSSASTLERKMFSLKKFFEWAVKEGYTETNPVEEFFKSEEAAIEVKVERIEKQKKLSIPSYHSVEARIIAKLAGKPKLQKLAYNVFYA